MSDYTHTSLELVGRHIPDDAAGPFNNMQEAHDAGYDSLNPDSGVYQIGVLIDGAFIPLLTEKAPHVNQLIRNAKAQKAADDSSSSATAPEQTS